MLLLRRLRQLRRPYHCGVVALLGVWLTGIAWGAPEESPADRRLTIHFDPTTRTIQGELRQPLRQATRFTLLEGLTVTSARRGDQELGVSQDAQGYWHLPPPADDSASITLHWQGTLPPAGQRHQIATEGSLLPTRAGWYPHLSHDAAPLWLTVSVPDGQLAVATGSLIDERSTTQGRYEARFYHPNTRDVEIASGPWQVREYETGGVTLRTLFPDTLDEAFGNLYLKHAAEHLAAFQTRLGPLPYTTFSIAASPAPVGLAFPGFTLLGERVIPLPFIPYTSLPHELMHAWWGAGVNVDYASGNWAEALTTYLADYALAEQRGEAADMRQRWLADLAALPDRHDMALVDFRGGPDPAGRLVGYQHGAMLFHMLRQKMGDDAFDRGLRYLADNWMHRTADWQTLIDAFQHVSDVSLEAFFAAWLHRPGRPSLTLESIHTERHADGYYIHGTLIQHGAHAPWPLEVPITVTTVAGEVTTNYTAQGLHTPFELRLDKRPLSLDIDPQADLLRYPDTPPATLRQLMLHPETQVLALDHALLPVARSLLGSDTDALDATHRWEEASQRPLFIIGTTEQLADWQPFSTLPPPQEPINHAGAARFWMVPNTVIGVLSGDDEAAITQLATSLRHHGQHSYVVHAHTGETQQAGRWSPDSSPLSITFKKHDFKE